MIWRHFHCEEGSVGILEWEDCELADIWYDGKWKLLRILLPRLQHLFLLFQPHVDEFLKQEP